MMDEIHSRQSRESQIIQTLTPINSDTDYNMIPKLKPNPKTQAALAAMYLVIGTFMGTLIRLVCNLYPEKYLKGVDNSGLYANIIGCFVLGMNQGYEHRKPHLDILLETGFCGSLTSWSSWMTALVLIEQQVSFDYSLVVFYISFALFNLSYNFGRHVGVPVQKIVIRFQISLSDTVTFLILLTIVSLIYITILLTYHLFEKKDTDSMIWELSLAIAPLGSSIRYFTTTRLNPKSWLPFGTLLVNYVAVIAGSFVSRYQKASPLYPPVIQYGFVCTLGTLSQWVKQQNTMKKVSQQWIYGFVGISLSYLISLLILLPY